MAKAFDAGRLDIPAFAQIGAELSGEAPLASWPRLADEAVQASDPHPVRWKARGERRHPAAVQPEIWLHLQASATLPLRCQRCLQPVATQVEVDRWFQFVADEATAEGMDEQAEEDVLVSSTEFDLLGLVEDEMLLALPLVPRHEVCPVPVKLAARDDDFVDEARPFDALKGLRGGKL